MSGKATGQVWEMQLPRPLKYLLLALADHADHDGGSIRPGVELIAWKCELEVRHVQRLLRELECMGIIVPEDGTKGGAGHTTCYRIDFDAAAKLPPKPRKRVTSTHKKTTKKGDIPTHEKGDIPTQMTLEKGDIPTQERVTSTHKKGDIPSRARTSIPLTVIEPSVEPSSSSSANEQNGDDDDDDFCPTYKTTLGKSWDVAVNSISSLFPDLIPSQVEAMLGDVERDVGPLPKRLLGDGLQSAYESLKAANGTIKHSRPYAMKVIVQRLKEVANVHH